MTSRTNRFPSKSHSTSTVRHARRHIAKATAIAAVTALAVTACSSTKSKSSGSSPSSAPSTTASAPSSAPSSAASSAALPSAPVNLTWWHNATADPGKAQWQAAADAYHAAHPNVTFTVDPIQNEDFTTKVPLALQTDNPPSIYQQWGGGGEATQVQSGKLMDMTAQVASWIGELGSAAKGWQVDGKQYGVPYDVHVVGFWYRTDLFTKAGITSPPATLDDLNADVVKLKAAGIAPIAIGSKDKWPDAFWWEYFALRECPIATVTKEISAQNLNDPCFIKAGDDMQAFLATKPFQTGFLGTPAQQGAGSSAGLVANGQAAMELQGDWEAAVMPSLATDKNFAANLSWFPFPTVSGGNGTPGVALGGGDGFSCTSKATAACPDFLKYISSDAVQAQLVKASAATLPANPSANSAMTDPTLKKVLAYLQQVPFNQTYFDQALPTATGQALDDAVANFFAGQGSPDDIAKSVAAAAAQY
jgi:raffinose/stachyose/melibiose transport system substrate-binding protein